MLKRCEVADCYRRAVIKTDTQYPDEYYCLDHAFIFRVNFDPFIQRHEGFEE